VQPVTAVRTTAIRLLRVHPLRAADALQLAAAIVAAEDHPATLQLVTLDERLAQAAEREGFEVVRPVERV
jgi:predicted nucleic acid-binding protein